MKRLLLVMLTAVLVATTALAQELHVKREDIPSKKAEYSPYVDQYVPQRVFFGDTHLHTSLSVDSGLIGNTLGPEEAFRFARGEEVVSSTGLRAKLIRPLDFLVVADHAEYLGIADLITTADPRLLANDHGKRWYEMFQKGPEAGWEATLEIATDVENGVERFKDEKLKRSVWDRVIDIASQFNEPGRFTALNGYEWTSAVIGDNLHRVVLFRDGPDRVKKVLPFSAFDSLKPEELWKFMARYEEMTGGQILAIPHNANLSNGRMFASENSEGKPFDKAYAQSRAQWEPLAEVTQPKGDGEAHPFLSPTDEFADFETWDHGNLRAPFITPKKPEMLEYEYARSALKLGLKHEAELGVNPFKFGMIGSTDSHTSLASTREENWFGKLTSTEPSPERAEEIVLYAEGKKPARAGWQLSAAGLAAVWAHENTRESIFDAMARKEVYATTGTRLIVRVFAGWDFAPEEVERPDFAAQGSRRGVPMGGDLTHGPAGKSPTFMVRALRDADGANLDRIQIIKGWLDKDGKTHEKIFNVALSDGRKVGKDGKAPPVGSTIDVANATYTNSIGDALLMAYWKDPDFDPKQRAFYYVRVIEIPTPRWTAHDAKRFGIKMPKEVRMTVQDRAYTSPIWYMPKG